MTREIKENPITISPWLHIQKGLKLVLLRISIFELSLICIFNRFILARFLMYPSL